SGPNESWRRDFFCGRRRRPVADPRAGRDGGRRPHGRARRAGPASAECVSVKRADMADTQDIATRDLAIVNARLIDPATGREEAGSVLLRNGMIAAVEWQGAPATGEGVRRIDAKGQVLT